MNQIIEIDIDGNAYRVIRLWLLNDDIKIVALYQYKNTWREVKNLTTISKLVKICRVKCAYYIKYLGGKN